MRQLRFPRKASWRLLLVAAVVVPVMMVGGTPAYASWTDHLSGQYGNFVDGGDALTDDWGDTYGELGNSICNGCADSRNNDLVYMWQAILMVEGLLGRDGLDGDFGPNTANATRAWQSRYWIGVDGRVGSGTWAKADDQLRWHQAPNGQWSVRYVSTWTGYWLSFTRGSSDWQDGGAYSLYSPYLGANGGTWAFFPQFIKIGYNQRQLSMSPVPCLC